MSKRHVFRLALIAGLAAEEVEQDMEAIAHQLRSGWEVDPGPATGGDLMQDYFCAMVAYVKECEA